MIPATADAVVSLSVVVQLLVTAVTVPEIQAAVEVVEEIIREHHI